MGRDRIAVVLITALSILPYLFAIGFYSDDWSIISGFHDLAAQHRLRIGAILPGFSARPVHGLQLLALFKLFGVNPLGYHLANGAVIIAAISAFHSLLIVLGAGRRNAFAVAVMLIVLPQLSTARVWIAASTINLSLLFMLLSLHCQLRFAAHGRGLWAFLAIASALASLAAYEIFAPLIVAFPLVLAFAERRRGGRLSFSRLAPPAAAILLVGTAAFWKTAFSGRTGVLTENGRYIRGLHQLVRPDYDWRVDSSLNIFAATRIELWEPVSGWFEAAWVLASGGGERIAIIVAISTAMLAWWRLASRDGVDAEWSAGRLAAWGSGVFLLGHAVFLIVPSILFSPTGMANRVLVAAALGVALLFVAAIRAGTNALSSKWRTQTFGLILTIVAGTGTARIDGIAGYWAQAWQRQQPVIAAMRADLGQIPPGATIIVDGLCPYFGPGVVFETNWDVGGAATLALGRPIIGDVVSSRMRLTPSGLATSMYREPRFYPFGPKLFHYDPGLHLVTGLTDKSAAIVAIRRSMPARDACPASYVGHGVPI